MKVLTGLWMKHSVAALFSLAIVACGNFGMSEEQLLQRARLFMEKKEYMAAVIEAKNTLQKNPANAEARYILGVISLDYGEYLAAEREFQRADLTGWGDGLARIGRARALFELDLYEELASNIRLEAGYSDTVKAELLALRAAAEASMEEPDQALATLREAVELDPAAFQVFMTQIQLLLDEDELQSANGRIEVALKAFPGNLELLLLQARIVLAEGDVGGQEELSPNS